jgi:hypothetical protein
MLFSFARLSAKRLRRLEDKDCSLFTPQVTGLQVAGEHRDYTDDVVFISENALGMSELLLTTATFWKSHWSSSLGLTSYSIVWQAGNVT